MNPYLIAYLVLVVGGFAGLYHEVLAARKVRNIDSLWTVRAVVMLTVLALIPPIGVVFAWVLACDTTRRTEP